MTPSISSTNKLLGYPSDARLLIINADDFGMCHSTTTAIFRALTQGIATSTTLMVTCAWALYAMRLLRENPAIRFGVHLTILNDGLDYRWKPLTSREHVPTLVDETGNFYPFDRMDEFLAQVNLSEVEREFRAQIEMVLAADLKPTHLDWHSVRIHKKPEIFDVMFKLAREYGLALRVRERPMIERVQSQNLPCNDYDFLDSYMLATEGKSEHYARLLRDLPVGLSEWAVHPGLADDELLTIEPGGARIRQADLDFLISPHAREIIAQEHITLLNYQPLQTAWQKQT